MRHVTRISKIPAKAQIGVCSEPESDFQVQMCIFLEILLGFVLPLSQLKSGVESQD